MGSIWENFENFGKRERKREREKERKREFARERDRFDII